MINISVYYGVSGEIDSGIKTLTVSGHADSDVIGKDLVCAAVSAIVTGGANALKETAGYEDDPYLHIELRKGYAHFKGKLHSNYQPVLKTILIMLKTVQESNPDFIEISEN